MGKQGATGDRPQGHQDGEENKTGTVERGKTKPDKMNRNRIEYEQENNLAT